MTDIGPPTENEWRVLKKLRQFCLDNGVSLCAIDDELRISVEGRYFYCGYFGLDFGGFQGELTLRDEMIVDLSEQAEG
jgi:hypothetical protein